MTNNIYSQLDKLLETFTRRISVIKAIKPNNLAQEKQRFLKANYSYNPQFTYTPLKANLKKFRKVINQALSSTPTTDAGQLYQARLQEMLTTIELLESIGTNEKKFTQCSITLFGKPQEKYLQIAEKILKLPITQIDQEPIFLTANEISQQIKAACQKINVTNKIEIYDDSDSPKITVSVKKFSGNIRIPQSIHRTQTDIDGVIAHEINTHIARTHQGRKQQYGIFANGTAGYIADEEGLATLMKHSIPNNHKMRRESILLLMMNQAIKSDFVLTFKLAQKFYPNDFDRAWDTTLRVKRGIANTQIPAAFTKDLYLQWAIRTGQKCIHQPTLLETAFSGKGLLNELQLHCTKSPSNITIDQIKHILSINS